MEGKADEVDLYNRALTATEVKAIFDAGSAGKVKPAPPPPPPPIAAISIVPASPIVGPLLCASSPYGPPQCWYRAYDTSQNLAFHGNGFANPAMAKDNILGHSLIHQPQFANDGHYGNGRSWISNSSNSWLKIDLGQIVLVDRIKLGRDRLGGYDDRDPGQFIIAVAFSDNVYANGNDSDDSSEYLLVFNSATAGFSGVISGSQTIQAAFPPVPARFIKIIVANPAAAIDEVEVFGPAPTPSAGTFLLKWGSQGSGDGQFITNGGMGVATDASGNVYVAESNNRIQKFSSSGTFLAKWGTSGAGDGQFSAPFGLATDASENVYVADHFNNRIQKFNSSGTFLTKWGIPGAGDGQLNEPLGVATDASGNVYVADTNNNRIQKFTSSGTFVAKWGSFGSADGQFNNPVGVATDASGNVYVADRSNHRIQKFDSSGAFLTKWGSLGSLDGQFGGGPSVGPNLIATDPSGNVYVADSNNHRIQKFSSSGAFLTKWGSLGSADGQFNRPNGVAADAFGNVYVADQFNNRIQKFASGN